MGMAILYYRENGEGNRLFTMISGPKEFDFAAFQSTRGKERKKERKKQGEKDTRKKECLRSILFDRFTFTFTFTFRYHLMVL